MTVMDDMDDGCDLEAPRAGSCWTRTFLPRGVRVRTSYAARNMRRSLNKAPSMLLAMVLSVHLTAWPIAMASVNMIQPTARQRIVNRERNEDALQDIVELVDRMHYGDMHATLQWDDSVDTLETTQVHAALRSESSFGQMTRALIETLRDPYSSYASKSEMELSPAALTFGLALQPADAERAAPMEGGGAADGVPARLLVSGVYAGSPAERAGLRTGDIVTEIGGVDEPAASLSKDALTALLRGRSLSLRVLRADAPVGAAAVGEWLTLSRDSKPYTPVMARALENGVGYLRIHQFTEKSTDELAAALAELAERGCSGMIVDLRNNPGGLLTEAMTQASLLLPDSHATVAFTVDAAGYHETHTAQRVLERAQPPAPSVAVAAATDGNMPTELQPGSAAADAAVAALVTATNPLAPSALPSTPVAPGDASEVPTVPSSVGGAAQAAARVLLPHNEPLVLLVDGGTASAAELFAAALRDNGRATIVGEHTFGKGLIQRVFPLPNGGALKLTIGEYLTPHHEHVVHGVGLQPDVACAATPAEADACLLRAATMARDAPRRSAPAAAPAANMKPLGRPPPLAAAWRAAVRPVPKVL